jgi:hypothetical protein
MTPAEIFTAFIIGMIIGFAVRLVQNRIRAWKSGGNIIIASRIDIDEEDNQ